MKRTIAKTDFDASVAGNVSKHFAFFNSTCIKLWLLLFLLSVCPNLVYTFSKQHNQNMLKVSAVFFVRPKKIDPVCFG